MSSSSPPFPRRALLMGSAGIAAGLVAVPIYSRVRASRTTVTVGPPASGSTRGVVCVGSASGNALVDAGPPRNPLHPDTLASFVDPLPIPRVRVPERKADPQNPGRAIAHYRCEMREAEVRMHRDVSPARMWTYDGEMPGATFDVRSGEPFVVEWTNALPERHLFPVDHTICGAGAELSDTRTVVHVHGAKVPPESDGYPENWMTPGQSRIARYPNEQDAATLWYHDHAMGLERLNQYAGLLGALFVRDAGEDSLGLPKDEHEIPLILCDRLFNADGQLHYPVSANSGAPWIGELYGDAILINGKLRPYLDVEPRAYRLRIINASNARVFALSLHGEQREQVMQQIGTDQGLLAAPVTTSTVALAAAERADVIVDFSAMAGTSVVLKNNTIPLLQFRVKRGAAQKLALPRRLRSITPLAPASAAITRVLTLDEYHDPIRNRMLMLLNKSYWKDAVTERPVLGSTEIWSFVNTTEDTHPIHLHLVRFQVLDRQPFDVDEFNTKGTMQTIGAPVPPPATEAGWKDTVRAEPGMITRIIVRFDGYAGRYVWHCHVLEHAANEMMRPFEVIAPA